MIIRVIIIVITVLDCAQGALRERSESAQIAQTSAKASNLKQD